MAEAKKYRVVVVVTPENTCRDLFIQGRDLRNRVYEDSGFTIPDDMGEEGNSQFTIDSLAQTEQHLRKVRSPTLGLYIINESDLVRAQLLIWYITGVNSTPLDPKLVFGQQLQAIATESKMTTGPFVYFGNFVSVKNENKPEEGLGKYLLAVAAQKILDRQWSGACIVVPTNKTSVYARMGFVCDAHTRRMPGYTIPAWFMKITPQDLLNAAGLDLHKAWRSRMMTRHARLRLMDPANVSRTLRNTTVYEIIEPIEYKP